MTHEERLDNELAAKDDQIAALNATLAKYEQVMALLRKERDDYFSRLCQIEAAVNLEHYEPMSRHGGVVHEEFSQLGKDAAYPAGSSRPPFDNL